MAHAVHGSAGNIHILGIRWPAMMLEVSHPRCASMSEGRYFGILAQRLHLARPTERGLLQPLPLLPCATLAAGHTGVACRA